MEKLWIEAIWHPLVEACGRHIGCGKMSSIRGMDPTVVPKTPPGPSSVPNMLHGDLSETGCP